MERKNYYALDVAKFISAFLVICIHTAPLATISLDANFILVQIIARLAVPLFFIISGFLFFTKINTNREWNDAENRYQLKHYLYRIFKIYIIWTILYLPFSYLLIRGQNDFGMALAQYIKDFFFNGSYYHLWFLPALLFGMCIVYFLRSHFSMRMTIGISMVLYLIGMAGNIYPEVLESIPGISTVYDAYTSIFSTTRNGFFFAPIFLSLGAYYAQHRREVSHNSKMTLLGFVVSFAGLCIECFYLRKAGFMHDLASMYLFLIPAVSFLFAFLLQLEWRDRPIYKMLRILSLLIYVSHIMFVVVLFALLPNAGNLLIYVLSCILSLVFSICVYGFSKKWRIFKHLY
ncbi:hypothetical protein Aargi30884_01310 [Amedibacterium intestinale]|uniref:Acyltransferase 3 domain-containing protein n=1 Tax=Amedibacterium intestinale TaxID=2583452 RepID=A0A6N4TE71_9FIRM|nr:acyltransferase [Amedibacterium intestinale]BBK21228.1 hypothetical protein Aargi30884_01310 [Amedibacterium intestinale]